ncbi:hypothetical protein EPN52_10150 [bacterium]|nr:MAG: hypothetical protein EPN52_10150 [bacterium]
MNAAEARKRRSGGTLAERTRKDSARAARIDRLVAEASIENALRKIMEIEDVSAAELARRIHAKPPQISRDLRGGLSKARVYRLVELGRALGYDFVPMFVPQDKEKRRTMIAWYTKMLAGGRS